MPSIFKTLLKHNGQFIIFELMKAIAEAHILIEHIVVASKHLKREVKIDCFLPKNVIQPSQMSLLLINDGQDMALMQFERILRELYDQHLLQPILCVAISCSEDRMMEYGIAGKPDYLGRGAKAGKYSDFIIKELLPLIKKTYNVPVFKETAFAGFSLGGLSALDMVWNYPEVFSKAGVFSGSLWWRSKDQHDVSYDDNKHRIMQQKIRKEKFAKGLKFFFQCGQSDEFKDRNNNGIIDAIDDTLDLIHELVKKGYTATDIMYLELEDGKHDVPTWGSAMPVFLKWGWGKKLAISNTQ